MAMATNMKDSDSDYDDEEDPLQVLSQNIPNEAALIYRPLAPPPSRTYLLVVLVLAILARHLLGEDGNRISLGLVTIAAGKALLQRWQNPPEKRSSKFLSITFANLHRRAETWRRIMSGQSEVRAGDLVWAGRCHDPAEHIALRVAAKRCGAALVYPETKKSNFHELKIMEAAKPTVVIAPPILYSMVQVSTPPPQIPASSLPSLPHLNPPHTSFPHPITPRYFASWGIFPRSESVCSHAQSRPPPLSPSGPLASPWRTVASPRS